LMAADSLSRDVIIAPHLLPHPALNDLLPLSVHRGLFDNPEMIWYIALV
jgi:hypothetical protein